MAAASLSSGERRPWADLPGDLLHAVADHLDLFAATRLAGVCTSWARAVAANTSVPLGTPCLLRSREGWHRDFAMHNGDYAPFQLLDLTRSGGELSFSALIAGMEIRRWVGGKDGWLATVDRRTCNAQLVNPYTGEQVDLPDIKRNMHLPPYVWEEQFFRRIVVCATPSGASGYLAIAMLGNTDILAVARSGSARWRALKKPSLGDPMYGINYTDAIANKGKVLAVTRDGDVYVWDIRRADAPPELVRPPRHDSKYEYHSWKLAESADGRRLILVCTYGSRGWYIERFRGRPNNYAHCLRFQAQGMRLFERDLDAAAAGSDGGGDGWAPVTSLGDHSLFLGTSYPFMARVVNRRGLSSDSECTAAQLRSNCVCVAAESGAFQRGRDLEYDMEVFDLGDDSYWYHPMKLSSFSRYFDQTPMWFRPTLKYYHGGTTTEEFGSQKTSKGFVNSVCKGLINLTGIRDLFLCFKSPS